MATITVRLDEKRADALRELAFTEKRRVPAQAEYLLELALDEAKQRRETADV